MADAFVGFYDALLPLVNFGPQFQRIESLAGADDEWLAQINSVIEVHRYVQLLYHLTSRVNSESSEAAYKFHPVLFDACIHFLVHPDIAQPPNKDTVFLPEKMHRFTLHGSLPQHGPLYSHVKMVEWTPGTSLSLANERVADFMIRNKSL